MKTGEITCQSILGRSQIGGMDYAVNPYLGQLRMLLLLR